MGSLFRWDSPLGQAAAKAGNLVILNILWLVCSLPVITMGAATTAMYYTVFQMQTNAEETMFRPFFRAFAKNFKQATLLWIPILLIAAVLVLDVRYLFALNSSTFVGVVVFIVCAVFLMVQSHLLPQLARFETTLKSVLSNGALLTILHMPSSLMMAVLNVLPVVIFFLFPLDFMRWLPLWAFIWFSLVAYINGRMLLKIWSKHMPEEEKESETEEE